MGLYSDEKKMQDTKKMKHNIDRLNKQKAVLSSVNAKLADDPTMLAEMTAKYEADKISALAAIAAIRAEIAAHNTEIQANETDYTTGEKAEHDIVATGETY